MSNKKNLLLNLGFSQHNMVEINAKCTLHCAKNCVTQQFLTSRIENKKSSDANNHRIMIVQQHHSNVHAFQDDTTYAAHPQMCISSSNNQHGVVSKKSLTILLTTPY